MLARQRQEYILERVTTTGGVRVANVVDELGVSEMTARRDITELVAQGLVERVHGGAVAPAAASRRGSAQTAPGRGTGTGSQQAAPTGWGQGTRTVAPPGASSPRTPGASPGPTPRRGTWTYQAVPAATQGSSPQDAPSPEPRTALGDAPGPEPRAALGDAPSADASDATPTTPRLLFPADTQPRLPHAPGGHAAPPPRTSRPRARSAAGTGTTAHRLAAHAAALVRPGDSLALSGGRTALEIARVLAGTAHFPTLTVVTASLAAAQLLFDAADAVGTAGTTTPARPASPAEHTASPAGPDHPTSLANPAAPAGPTDPAERPTSPTSPQARPTIVLTGGQRAPSGTLVGPASVDALHGVHVDWVLLDAYGFSPETGLTAPSLTEAATGRALVSTGGRVAAVVEAAAWGAVGLRTFCATQDVDVVVTDTQPEDSVVRALHDVGTTLIVAADAPSTLPPASPPGDAPDSNPDLPTPTPGDQP